MDLPVFRDLCDSNESLSDDWENEPIHFRPEANRNDLNSGIAMLSSSPHRKLPMKINPPVSFPQVNLMEYIGKDSPNTLNAINKEGSSRLIVGSGQYNVNNRFRHQIKFQICCYRYRVARPSKKANQNCNGHEHCNTKDTTSCLPKRTKTSKPKRKEEKCRFQFPVFLDWDTKRWYIKGGLGCARHNGHPRCDKNLASAILPPVENKKRLLTKQQQTLDSEMLLNKAATKPLFVEHGALLSQTFNNQEEQDEQEHHDSLLRNVLTNLDKDNGNQQKKASEDWYSRIIPKVKQLLPLFRDGAGEEGCETEQFLDAMLMKCRMRLKDIEEQDANTRGGGSGKRIVSSGLTTSKKRKTHGTEHL